MSCCCLPPDRIKLTVKSKIETSSRVKMGQESKWAKDQDGLLLFTPLKESKWAAVVYPMKSQTNSEQQERNKQQGQNGPRVKVSAFVIYLFKESKWAKGQNAPRILWLKSAVKTIESNWAKRSQVGPGPF